MALPCNSTIFILLISRYLSFVHFIHKHTLTKKFLPGQEKLFKTWYRNKNMNEIIITIFFSTLNSHILISVKSYSNRIKIDIL